ncbi:MAG: response regulator [Gemmatimonadota bacterium]|jgi:CheY-like chemotaxis protein/class 3 adenylate cyclase
MSFPARLKHFAREIQRRRVHTTAIAYVVVAVTVIELSGAIFAALQFPDWAPNLVTILLLLGFPVVLVMAWVFDIGLKRTSQEDGEPRRRKTRGRAARRVQAGPSIAKPTGKPTASLDSGSFKEPAAPPDPDRIKRAAIGHVRHELKTPINGILGYSEMLLEDLEDEDRGAMASDLERIGKGGRQLLRLIDSTLDPGKIEQAVDIDLDAYSSEIRVNLRNPINAVIGYAELLIEHAEENDGDAYLDDLGRIRNAAFRLLELSQDLVEVATAHDPSLGRAEKLAEASHMAETILSKARPTIKPSDDGAGTLLVVDDNPDNRNLLSRQLARAGFMVETAEDGEMALERLADRSFDLVLLDVIMPRVDGLETLRRIKRDHTLAEIPVIMLSSLDDVESSLRCIELGADDFLHKPFHPTLLQARIGASLELRRMREYLAGGGGGMDEVAAGMVRASFPEAIAQRVRGGEKDILENFGEATVLWCDVDRAARHKTRDPGLIAARIQLLLGTIEEVTEKAGIETITTAGEGVGIVGGVPTPDGDHAHAAAGAALAVWDALDDERDFDAPLRMALDSGEVTAGVFGRERKEYRIWGEPMDVARSLGSQARSSTILVSPNTHRVLDGIYRFGKGGVQEVPGRGSMKTWVLEGAG